MIKFYQYIKDYAKDTGRSRQYENKEFNNGTSKLIKIPKGVKFYEIDKEAIVKEYILSLTK